MMPTKQACPAGVAAVRFVIRLSAPPDCEPPDPLGLRLTPPPSAPPTPGVSHAATPVVESGLPAMMPPEPDAEIIRVWPVLPVDAAAGRLPMLATTIASPRSNRIKRGPASGMNPPCTSTPATLWGPTRPAKQHIDDQSTAANKNSNGPVKERAVSVRRPLGSLVLNSYYGAATSLACAAP